MADFLIAFNITSEKEGGYSNRVADKGGETYRGISRKNWPQWRGWYIIDEYKKKNKIVQGQYIKSSDLDGLVKVFFYEHFWKPINGDKINNQSIANVLYDWRITSGYHAVSALQKVVGEVVDGVIGPKTLAAVNAGCQEQIFNQFVKLRAKFYNDIVMRDESQRANLKGWLNRTNSFTFQ